MMSLLLLLPAGYLLVVGFVYFYQDHLVFAARRGVESELDREAAEKGFEPWRNAKGERIGWQSQGGDASNPLLVCGGNGGYVLNRGYYRSSLAKQGCDWKVYLVEYPGFGARPGVPGEKALTDAALEAFDMLAGPGRKVRVVGESLGTGVASAVAGRRADQVAGLLLVMPYDSLIEVARSQYPWLPVGMLLRTRFESSKNLTNYPGPVAVIVGEGDTIVPTRLGVRLFATYPGEKKLWRVPGAGHNCSHFIGTEWRQVAAFLQSAR